jgi:ribosomal protein L37E
MADATETDDVRQILSEAFPDIRCLRCGHDQFLVVTDIDALGTGHSADSMSVLALHAALAIPDSSMRPVVTLACERCGHLEHHVTRLLARARRPIPLDIVSND